VAEKDDYLLDLLVDLGFTDAEQVAKAREEATAAGVGVVDFLVANKVIRPGDVTQAKAAQFGAEVVHLSNLKIEDDVIAMVPRDVARKYRVIPVFKAESKVAVAIADPSDLNTIDTLTHLLGAEIEVRVASEQDIEQSLSKYYGGEKKAMMDSVVFKDVMQELTESNVEVKADDGGEVEADAPLIKLVNQIIMDAFKLRASDIHLEPLEKRFRLRYRIDGMMQEVPGKTPKRLQAPIIARLKIQAGMIISEHRIPQDGRIQTKVGNKVIDLRVSCLPTNHGESIVMRILDKEGLRLGLAELGFLTDDQQTFERIISLPDGILLVTGPTGSGKTTTLYS
jgi:general secretion pathway protein E/type IV pilus assembly protein PilB